MSKLNPKNGFAVLKPVEEQEQTYGNIVIPDLGKERPEMGEVIAVSQTYNWHRGEYVDSQFQVGQKVLIPKMGTMKISVGGEDYFLTKDTEILSVVED
jgi:chaperonin GroES